MSADARAAYGNGRVSAQRRTIAEAAAAMPGAFTVEALAREVHRADASAGVATVYRAVSAMVSTGWLERVGERDGSALFARCDAGPVHHHHVVCDGCGRVEATACTVGAPNAGSFEITRHEITLYGLCPSCAAETRETER